MKSFIKTIIFFFLGALSTLAQTTISGTISNSSDLQIEYANVILYDADTKKLITGVISSEEGTYLFESLASGNYYLEISTLGYKTNTSEVFELADSSKTINFTLEGDSLDEVIISSKRPIIRQTAEKLIVDLENSEMLNSNVEDVMKKVPGVIVANGNLSYAGQGNLRILINGKSTDYMDMNTLLREMPADNIAKVELIQQPGAEYDAEGSGPLINIILKKNVRLGTHGNVKAMVGHEDDFEYRTSASIASYKGKLNWQANAGYSKSTWRDDLILSRKVGDQTYNQTSLSPFDPVNLNVGAGLDYYISEKHSIGANASRAQSTSDRLTKNSTTIIDVASEATLLTDNSFDRDRITIIVNPYYEYNDEKNIVKFDFNYVDYSYDNENNLFQVGNSTIDYDNQRYFQDASYKIFTYKGDYKREFNENFNWSAGAKYSMVDSDSELKSFTQNESGDYVNNASQSNRFIIDETILGIYSKINLKYDKWNFSGGLRWEESNTEGTSLTENETKNRNISKLFPSASIGRAISENLGVNLSYSYRIQRPSYSTLNSFVYYYDPYTFEEGNPNLKPAFTNRFHFNLTYDNQPFFSVSYGRTTDALFDIITQNDTTAETSRSVINIAENNNFSASLFAPLSIIDGLDGYTGVIVNYNEYQSKDLAPVLDLSKWSLTWYTSAEYELPWKINAEISGYYTNGGLDGQIDYEWLAGIDFAMSKKFLNNQLKVTLEFEEILNRKFYGNINYDNVDATITSDWARQNVFLQLNYSFGSKYGKDKNRDSASKEEQDRIDNKN